MSTRVCILTLIIKEKRRLGKFLNKFLINKTVNHHEPIKINLWKIVRNIVPENSRMRKALNINEYHLEIFADRRSQKYNDTSKKYYSRNYIFK